MKRPVQVHLIFFWTVNDGGSDKPYQPDSADSDEWDDEEETGNDETEVSENESDKPKEEVEKSDSNGTKSNEAMKDDGDSASEVKD